jgi:hypothetical protein
MGTDESERGRNRPRFADRPGEGSVFRVMGRGEGSDMSAYLVEEPAELERMLTGAAGHGGSLPPEAVRALHDFLESLHLMANGLRSEVQTALDSFQSELADVAAALRDVLADSDVAPEPRPSRRSDDGGTG